MIRSLVEKLSRRIVFKRRLPAQFGSRQVYVTPEGGLRYWKPSLKTIDGSLLRVVDTFIRPGNTVWDIGANVGLFTFAAAHRVGTTGKCLGIEPDTWLVTLLHRSAQLNPDLTIDVLPFAISDQVGLARLNIAQRARATNYLSSVNGSTETGGVRYSLLVPTSTLDTLLTQYDKPDLIKIDVETAEHLVLKNAEQMLSIARPVIYCEVSSENKQVVLQLLLKHNYRLFDGDDPSFKAVVEPVTNTLALPSEHWYIAN